MRGIRTHIQQLGLFTPGETVVVGVSGGPDSLCLLHVLRALDVDLHAATLDHGLRGEASAADADFVAQTARAWDVPVTVASMDVPALAEAHKLSIEEAARQARYTFLAQTAARQGASTIAVAHNADDQSETVLMHFLRGSGPAGLRGMRPVARLGDYHMLPGQLDAIKLRLVRPLLDITRAQIEAYCAEHGLRPRFDRSNLDTTYFRNQLRHEVIPYLERINPNLRALLRRTAEVTAADYDALQALHSEVWARVCLDKSEDAVVFDLAGWRALSLSAQRATLRRAVYHLAPALRDVSFASVDDAVRVARCGDTGVHAALPGGVMLRVGYDRLALEVEDYHPPPPPWPLLPKSACVQLPPPPIIDMPLPDSGWRFSLMPAEGAFSPALLQDPWQTPLALPAGAEMLLRTRRPGDRFAPQGMEGHTQKLSDFMINAKIPALWRDCIPLLVVDGAIAWVAGWRVSQNFIVEKVDETYFISRFLENVLI